MGAITSKVIRPVLADPMKATVESRPLPRSFCIQQAKITIENFSPEPVKGRWPKKEAKIP